MKTLILVSLILSTSAFAAKKSKCDDDSNYPEISYADLKTAAEKKEATVIDVNSKESFEGAHVTNAIHYGTVKGNFAKELPADKNAMIVAYCGGPACTAWKKAAKDACKLGYTNIKHYKDGISGWKKASNVK